MSVLAIVFPSCTAKVVRLFVLENTLTVEADAVMSKRRCSWRGHGGRDGATCLRTPLGKVETRGF